ncbi:FG-GAP-like repeat-containing protein [Streptomyces sp. NBC_01537]|uniref:FG-GAP-like repeat-containing protein n=1 Tax=Streptomyces sp. NBC_01537 TaxID=2903896 RepID=UPI00386C83F3
MGRHALRRGRLAAAVSITSLAVVAGLIPLFVDSAAGTAQAAESTRSQIVVDTPQKTEPQREERLLAAGETGFLHRQGDIDGLLWTSYADGTTVSVEGPDGVYEPESPCYDIYETCRSGWYGQGGDTVALPNGRSGVALWTPGSAGLRTIGLYSSVSEQTTQYLGTFGSTVIALGSAEPSGDLLELNDFLDGEQRTRSVTGFPTAGRVAGFLGGDESGALIMYILDEVTRIGYLDFAAGTFTDAFAGADNSAAGVLTDDSVGWYTSTSGLHLKPRTDLAAEETVPVAPGATTGGRPVLVGNWLLLEPDNGSANTSVKAVSLTDGSTRTLLSSAYGNPLATPDGGALVAGGTGAADWWVQRITQGADGTLQLTKVLKVPPYEKDTSGLALSRGHLRIAKAVGSGGNATTTNRTLTVTDGRLTASEPVAGHTMSGACPYASSEIDCLWIWGNAVEGDVFLSSSAVLGTFNDDSTGGGQSLDFGTSGGAIVDVSDKWAVYNSGGTSPMQYVGEFGQGQILKRSVRAAALNGGTLWSATATAGQLTSYSLTESKTLSTVSTGSGCVPDELQAVGHWVYWSCTTAGTAGVYDTTAKTSVPVTPGDVLLGDGFTVRHDHTADTLVLTDASTAATSVLVSAVPDSGLAADRRYRWTVDEYTGLVAWVGALEQVHITTTGVTASNPTAYTSQGDYYISPKVSDTDEKTWNGYWLLSRPVSSWSVTFTSLQGGVTHTVTGGPATAYVSAAWNGKTASGAYLPNGEFTWKLKATGLGSSSAAAVKSGSAFMSGGAAVRRDYGSIDGVDGRGDLITLSSSGALTYRFGTKFTEPRAGSGWPSTIKAVPFGDLSGDRCNDLLVRLASGALRLYKPGCGSAPKPSTAYTALGTGWNQYDILTSPGDLTGDGRADLIARNSSTGAIYLYKATSAGKLSARVKLYSNWKGYKKIIGAGDLNGDGRGDLLAQDKSNELWRYYGTGAGTFGAKAKVFNDWGSSYNVIIGVNDITDDGKADLVSRDTSGTLWRNAGNGAGSFGGRTKISTGWGSYKGLF